MGLAISLIASAINFGVSRFMLRSAKRFDSITLEADAHHLMTDVWTSVGVVAALAVVMFAPPKWAILDPIIAIIVGLNIIRTGVSLIRSSMAGMMDSSLPAGEVTQIEDSDPGKRRPRCDLPRLADAQIRLAALHRISSAGARRHHGSNRP